MASTTRRTYLLVARSLKRALQSTDNLSREQVHAVQNVAVELSHEFANDNPHFDRKRFWKEIGFTECTVA